MFARILSKVEGKKKKEVLIQLATREFENARGSFHLKILREAKTYLNNRFIEYERERKQLENQIISIQNNQNNELRVCLEKHLISTTITTLPGIGQSLGSILLNRIYQGHLSDLKNAYRYSGFGQAKQYWIDDWVQENERKVSALLLTPFPGKNEITFKNNQAIKQIQTQISQRQNEKATEEALLNQIEKWIQILDKVTLQDFIRAKLGNTSKCAEIDQYMIGVFAEWEPLPNWFKEAILRGKNV